MKKKSQVKRRKNEPVAQRRYMVIGALALFWYFMLVAVIEGSQGFQPSLVIFKASLFHFS